jgi:hypothetical protein
VFGFKLWYSGVRGKTRCDLCGREVDEVASPGWFSFQLWCARCLRAAGRNRWSDELLLERRKRANDVLAQMSVVAEGTAMGWDSEGHGQPESRGPISEESIDRQADRDPGDCPPESRSLYDHWACRSRARGTSRSGSCIGCCSRRRSSSGSAAHRCRFTSCRPATTSPTLIATSRGSPAEVAARFARYGVTMSHVRRVRPVQRRDPETGDLWLWPPPERETSLSPEARKRMKAEAQEVALRMLAEGQSQNRVSEATGIPGRTLRRILNGERDVE